jgi:hypothetical protein
VDPDGVCPECRTPRHRRAEPLVVDWEPGSDAIGDFVWEGVGFRVIVSEPAFSLLKGRFRGFEAGPVEMAKEPSRAGRYRRQPRVRLPYAGPELRELRVTTWAHLDRERSSGEIELRCGTCEAELWKASGIERGETHWDMVARTLTYSRTKRVAGEGLSVHMADLSGADIFRVHELPGWIFCTDPAREFVEDRAFSNVVLLEMGDAI